MLRRSFFGSAVGGACAMVGGAGRAIGIVPEGPAKKIDELDIIRATLKGALSNGGDVRLSPVPWCDGTIHWEIVTTVAEWVEPVHHRYPDGMQWSMKHGCFTYKGLPISHDEARARMLTFVPVEVCGRNYYLYLIHDPDTDTYTARCLELASAIEQGDSWDEAVSNGKEAIRSVLEAKKG